MLLLRCLCWAVSQDDAVNPGLSMTSEGGQTIFTQKGSRLLGIFLMYALSAARVASISEAAARGNLSMNSQSSD